MCIASCKRFILSFVSHRYLFAVTIALLSVQEQCQCSIVPDELVQICFIEMRQYDFDVDASIFVVKTMLSVDSRDQSSDPSNALNRPMTLFTNCSRVKPENFSLLQLAALSIGSNMFPVDAQHQYLKSNETVQKWLKINLEVRLRARESCQAV